jgi:hypothetical protein
LGQSILVVLCAGFTLLLVPTSRHQLFSGASLQQPLEVISFSYYSIKLWFHTEGKLTAVLIIPSSWGFPTGPLRHHASTYLLQALPPVWLPEGLHTKQDYSITARCRATGIPDLIQTDLLPQYQLDQRDQNKLSFTVCV